jgi:beta-glucoside kinase
LDNYLALDIGGTNIKFGLVNEQGDILLKDKFATQDSKQAMLKSIQILAKQYTEQYDIKGIAISAPGMIDAENGYFITAGALLSLYQFDCKVQLETLTGLPVEVENDVNCVALAEKWLGNGVGVQHFICLTIGTGIGGAIIINNSLYRGYRHMAGEFGYMITKDIQGDVSQSILSNSASTRAGIVEAYFNKTGIHLDGEQISELYQNNNEIAVDVIEAFAQNMAIGIYNLIFSLAPQKVLIGGAVSNNTAFISLIRHKVNHLVYSQDYLNEIELPEIQTCRFNNDSGLIGALYNFKFRQKKVG